MLRKFFLLAPILVLIQAHSAHAQGLFGFGALNEEKDAALQSEKLGKWKQINWRPTMQEALADAAKTQKPIMVALIVGKEGKKNANEC